MGSLFSSPTRLALTTALAAGCSLVACSQQAYAGVNMEDGSFVSTWTDFQAGRYSFQRTYNSRSLHRGLFGFGWCSDLDVKITKQDTAYLVDDCGKLIRFERATAATFNSLNPVLGTLNVSDSAQVTWTSATRTVVFNGFGAPIRIETRAGHLEIDSDIATGLPRTIEIGGGGKMRIAFDPDRHRVSSINLPNGTSLHYRYQDDDLTEAQNAWNNRYSYSYDRFHNLLTVTYPDLTHETLSYDEAEDRVTRYEGRHGCFESYRFEGGALSSTATAHKYCDQKLVSLVTFKFQYTRNAQGEARLLATQISDSIGGYSEYRRDLASGNLKTVTRGIAAESPARKVEQ